MKVFGARPPSERLRTFEAPADGRERAAPDDPLRALSEAAREAEVMAHALDRARAAYRRAPTAAHLEEVRRVSLRALEAEAAFDRAWSRAASRWFAHAHASLS